MPFSGWFLSKAANTVVRAYIFVAVAPAGIEPMILTVQALLTQANRTTMNDTCRHHLPKLFGGG